MFNKDKFTKHVEKYRNMQNLWGKPEPLARHMSTHLNLKRQTANRQTQHVVLWCSMQWSWSLHNKWQSKSYVMQSFLRQEPSLHSLQKNLYLHSIHKKTNTVL